MADKFESRPKGLSGPSYHTYDQEARDYWDTHLEHNALRQNPKTGWAAERSYLLEAAGDVLRELTGSTGFIASGGTEKGYLNEKLNRLKREARTVSPKYMAERRYVEGLGGPAFGPAEGEKGQLEDIGISIARIKPKSEEAALAKSILSNIADSDSYLLNSNIDKLRRKLGLLSEEELDRLIDEPRPKDQPRPPLLLEGPPEEPGKKPSKGRVMRGIGSLMRGRNVFSLIQALREGYELLPEEYQVLDEAFQYLKGTEFNPFGMDKPGIESFKELLGISPEDLGETIPLPGSDDLPMDEASRLSRAEKLGFSPEIYYHGTAANIVAFDLNHPDRKDQGWLGTGVYLTDSPALSSVYATLKGYTKMDKDRAKNVMPLRIRLKNPYHATRQEKETMMLRMHNKSTAEARQIADSWTENLKKKGHDGVILQYDPKEVGKANAVREVVVFDTSDVKSAFSKFDPAYSRSPELSKAAGGFIDKPLYDDQRMIG